MKVVDNMSVDDQIKRIADSTKNILDTINAPDDTKISDIVSYLKHSGYIHIIDEDSDGYPTDVYMDNMYVIPSHAFYNCRNLAWTSLQDEVTSIDYHAFAGCYKLALTSLPDGLTSIGQFAFFRCYDITLTELPGGLKTIREGAFQYCTGLTSLTFKGKPNSISSSAFSYCTNLRDIKVPWSNGEVPGAPWGASATITYDYHPTE